MIRHIVLTKFKANTEEDKISEIYAGLSALTKQISGARNFTGGRSNSAAYHGARLPRFTPNLIDRAQCAFRTTVNSPAWLRCCFALT